jgi:hypothetical protein
MQRLLFEHRVLAATFILVKSRTYRATARTCAELADSDISNESLTFPCPYKLAAEI